jgi:hypothetical protein
VREPWSINLALSFISFLSTVQCLGWDNCKYVRLDLPGKSMEHVALREQWSGDCYAETAVELFDAYRFSHGETSFDRQTEGPFSAAELQDEKFHNSGSLDYGNINSVLQMFKEKGACAIDHDWSISNVKGQNISAKQVLAELENIARFSREHQGLWDQKTTSSYLRLINGEQFCAEKEGWSNLLPDLQALGIAARQDQEVLLVLDTYKKICASSWIKPTLSPVYHNVFSWRDPSFSKKQQIDESLNSTNPQPVGIGFDSKVIADGKRFSFKQEDHAAAIIGRRRGKQGQCQYLVRLSSGDLCGDKEIAGQDDISSDWSCYGGNVWIDSDSLMKATRAMDYFN